MDQIVAQKLILGTMTIGMQVNEEAAGQMVEAAFSEGLRRLDTAYVYGDGETERILGRVLSRYPREAYRVDIKVNPRPAGNLSRETVFAQVKESLARLKIEKADVLYLHFPSSVTPIGETAQACTELHEQGLFDTLGVSNFPADLLERLLELCESRGYVRPRVYQGMYNALSRRIEELFPLLEAEDIRFAAFNPLAGGILTGRYQGMEAPVGDGRFAHMPGYKDRYWKESYFRAMEGILPVCRELKTAPAEAALRWLIFHSRISRRPDDGVILGASRLEQLESNIRSVQRGPLPEGLVSAFGEAAAVCAQDAPQYWRYLS